MSKIDFKNLNYKAFCSLAEDDSLSMYEKIGFPDEYRKDIEPLILQDIILKCDLLNKQNQTILDIGCGCSNLPSLLIDFCNNQNHKLIMNDSQQMLNLLPSGDYIKVPGFYPLVNDKIKEAACDGFDVIICYSVFHYIVFDSNLWDFIDNAISLLKNGGHFIIGDIPNISKRKRFFASKTGVEFHKQFMKTNEDPVVNYNNIEFKEIDESVLDAVIQRARNCGCDAYILPQPACLTMSNRRDDILIFKP